MSGTGLVKIGKETVYAHFSAVGHTARLRLSADECDRFDLFAGNQVRVGLPGRDAANALVTAVAPAPPFAWVEMEIATGRVVSQVG